MSKFDPSKLKGHSSESAVYWRTAALSSTELARGFRVRAEAAEAKLAYAAALLRHALPPVGMFLDDAYEWRSEREGFVQEHGMLDRKVEP